MATHEAPQGPGAYASPGVPGAPFGAPEPPRRRSWFARHKILTGVLVAVVIGIGAGALGGGQNTTAPGPSAEDTAAPAAEDTAAPAAEDTARQEGGSDTAPAEAAAGIGTPVRDGKFEFTVTGVEPGVTTVGDEFLGEKAQGQFVLVHLTVTNIGEEAQRLFADNQILVDEQGRQHSASTTAGLYLEGNDTFVSEINPGNTVEGTVVFDIPADAVPASIELHDSAFSGGVTVSLAP